MTSPASPAQLQAAIAALEAQRAVLGDAVVDMALAPLRAGLQAVLPSSGASLAEGAAVAASAESHAPADTLDGRQRRQLTVLFADVVGSTRLVEQLDDEDSLDALNPALRQFGDAIAAHGGKVLRYMGDGLLAAFGTTESLEDDAERAVRAGLALLQAGRDHARLLQQQGIDGFAVRVGLHTGSVVLGAGVEADNTAMGSAVNLAARMEQSAPPDTLRVSHTTWSHVRGLFDADEQPPLLVKGLDEPVRSWLVRRPLPSALAAAPRGVEGIDTPLMGRAAELAQLSALFSGTGQPLPNQALTLVAPAGVGKSRLLLELQRAHPQLKTLTARAQPGSGLRPWGLLRDLLQAHAGIDGAADAATARQTLVAALQPWLADTEPAGNASVDSELDDSEPAGKVQADDTPDAATRPPAVVVPPGPQRAPGLLAAQTLGQLAGFHFGDQPAIAALDPQALRDRGLALARLWLTRLLAHAPLLLVVEDLHWADDSSLDLLQHLVQHTDDPLPLLLMTARPELLERRADWPALAASHTVLALPPLAAADATALGQALLQRLQGAAPVLVQRVVTQAEGNPYYMEELVRRLIDDGVVSVQADGRWAVAHDRIDSLRLPTTLVGVLQARLDAQPAPERQALRHASIVGHEFWDGALAEVGPQAAAALPALRSRALVHQQPRSRLAGSTQWRFDHHLLHQVTYDTVLKAERRQGHAAVARWLQARLQTGEPDDLALTGEHAERGGDDAFAIDCFDRAAAAAASRFANQTARDFLERALRLLGDSDRLRAADLLQRLFRAADLLGDRQLQRQVGARWQAMLPADAPAAQLAQLHYNRSLLADRLGDVGQAGQLAQDALAVAEPAGVDDIAALAHAQLSWLAHGRGDSADASRHLAHGLDRAVHARTTRPTAEGMLLTLAAQRDIHNGYLQPARGLLQRVLAIGEAHDRRLLLGALDNLTTLEMSLAHWDAADTMAGRLLAAARDLGARARIVHALNQRTAVAVAAARWQQALPLARAAHAAALRSGDKRPLGWSLLYLGDALCHDGDSTAGRTALSEALALFDGMQAPIAHGINGMLALADWRAGDAAAATRRVHALVALHDGDTDVLHAEHGLQGLWAAQQVLHALGDRRAGPLLAQLQAEVQALVTRATPASDRARLLQAMPLYRAIVQAPSPG